MRPWTSPPLRTSAGSGLRARELYEPPPRGDDHAVTLDELGLYAPPPRGVQLHGDEPLLRLSKVTAASRDTPSNAIGAYQPKRW